MKANLDISSKLVLLTIFRTLIKQMLGSSRDVSKEFLHDLLLSTKTNELTVDEIIEFSISSINIKL